MAQLPDDDKDENADDTEWKVNENFEWSLYNSAYFQVTKNRAKKLSDGSWRSCYGQTIIPIKESNGDDDESQDRIKRVQWHVQVVNTVSKNIMIGICKNTWNTDSSNYGCYNTQNGYMYYSASPGYRYNAAQSVQYGKALNGNNSNIIVTLNVHDKTLSFNIDNQDFGVACSNLTQGQYRLCVDISSPNDEVLVTSEKIEYYNTFSIVSSSMKEWHNAIKLINENIKKQEENIGNNKNKSKNKGNLDKLLKNAHYISVIKQNKKKLEKELKDFDDNLVSYEKALQKYLIPPKKDNYKTWNSDDIIKWIITLDSGAFIVYTKKLSKALQENQITGDDLKDISRNDLSLFGVTVFKDRVRLMKHFESLVSGGSSDNDDNDQTNIDEGEN